MLDGIAPATLSNGEFSYRKQIRVNGTPRRALDLVGEMKVVLFLPQGAYPALRRLFR